jgi:single-stranded DNA-binding protein
MNKVILTGKIDSMHSPKEGITHATMITIHKWTDKMSKEKKEESENHSLIFFGSLSELMNKFGKIGINILVEGFLKTSKEHIRKDGVICINKDIIIKGLEFLQPIRIEGNKL